MENVIVIEQKTFEELMARFNRLAGMVDRFCRKALQTLRDNGTLAYSQIVRKMFYRAEDVRRIVPLVEERRTLAALKGKTI